MMLRAFAAASALLLAGCATPDVPTAAPYATYRSAKARAAIVECLLNRLSGNSIRPTRTDAPGVTSIHFTSVDQWTNPAAYLFTVTDEGAGSTIEARLPGGFAKRALPTAETCF